MLRQLLTLLAVISGLGLSAQPALAAEASVVSVATTSDLVDCQTVVTRPLEFSRAAVVLQHGHRPCKVKPVIVLSPTVQLQADRARE